MEWGNSDTAICPKGKMREEYTYTAMGKVASKTAKVIRLVSGVEKTAELTVQHSYNAWGAVSQTIYPTTYTGGGTAVPGYLYNYSYDAMGRPSGTTYQVNGAGSPQTLVDSVLYNTAGQLTQMRWFNLSGGGSQTETRQYNALGQMTRLTVPGQLDREYRFSATANDNKAISQKDYISGEELEYQYDSLGRLSRAETTGAGGWGLSWVYDGFGNRLQQNAVKGTVPTQSILVDPATNRVQSHTYDANGNTTNTPAQGNMAFDESNRLKTVASDTYAYSPANQRMWKNSDYVLWGVDGQRLVTAQVAVIGSDLRFTQVSFDSYSHGRRLQVSDRLGSVGNYYPFGEAKSGTVTNADSFATYYRDSTALDYAQQRFYQPGSGRFLTTDPAQSSAKLTNPGSWNRYDYSFSDPVNRSDPQGLDSANPLAPRPGCIQIWPWGMLCMVSITAPDGNSYFGAGFAPSLQQNGVAVASELALQSADAQAFAVTRGILEAAAQRLVGSITAVCADFLKTALGAQTFLIPGGGITPNVAGAISGMVNGLQGYAPRPSFQSGYTAPVAMVRDLFNDGEKYGYVHAYNPNNGDGVIYWRTDDRDINQSESWLLSSVLHELLHLFGDDDYLQLKLLGQNEVGKFSDNITKRLQEKCFP